MSNPTRVLGCILVALVSAHVAPATGAASLCESVFQNRIPNCGFEVGEPPSSWTIFHGRDFARAASPHSGAFAATMVSEPGNISVWGFALRSDCVAAQAGERMTYGAYFRRPGDNNSCRARVRLYSDSGCLHEISTLSMGYHRFGDVGWVEVSGEGRASGTSAHLELECFTHLPGPPQFLVDDAFLGPVPSAVEIPTLGSLGLVAFVAALAAAAVCRASRP